MGNNLTFTIEYGDLCRPIRPGILKDVGQCITQELKPEIGCYQPLKTATRLPAHVG
jgi:hypothetical protein